MVSFLLDQVKFAESFEKALCFPAYDFLLDNKNCGMTLWDFLVGLFLRKNGVCRSLSDLLDSPFSTGRYGKIFSCPLDKLMTQNKLV